jgi:hypothetical protein
MRTLSRRWRRLIALVAAGWSVVGVTSLAAPASAQGNYPNANGCFQVQGGNFGWSAPNGGHFAFAVQDPITLAGTSGQTGVVAQDPLLGGYVATGTTDCSGYTYTLRVATAKGGPIAVVARSAAVTPTNGSVTSPTLSEVDVTWPGGFSDATSPPTFSASFTTGNKNTDPCIEVSFTIRDASGATVDVAPSDGGTYEACIGSSPGLSMQG